MKMLFSILPLLSSLFCLGIGAFVLSRNLKNKVNLPFALGMLVLALMEFAEFMAAHSALEGAYLFWKKVSFAGQIFLPGPWLMFSLTFGRSNPSQYLIRWKYGIILAHLTSAGFLVALGLGRFLTDELRLESGGFWFSVFLLLMLTAVLANFEKTFRSAGHVQRWRIKLLILGIGSIFVFMIYVLSQVLLFSSVEQDFSSMISTVILIGCGFITFSLIRHRLLDVDIFVSRYVIYNSFTVVIVGAYLLTVGILAQAIKSLGGDFNLYFGSLFVFLSILLMAILLLSHDIRKRFKIFINRHFYRDKYDYRKEWLELTDRLCSKMEIGALLPPLAHMIFETFWIKQVILWLYDDRDREFKLVYAVDGPRYGSMRWDRGLIQVLKDRDCPIVLDDSEEDLRKVLDLSESAGGLLKAMFKSLKVSILIPLIVKKELIGILGLSRSHSGTTLDDEDYDLMRTMAKQAASTILNAQLSQDLVRSKEMETFHSLSTFLVHDLKNFVSMLSLVVENMNRNFDNPEFRKEALTNISQTVAKMKRLMEQLATLSQNQDICQVPVDLNELVGESLAEIGKSIKSRIVQDFKKLPVILADRTLIKKVITNLIINAEEAIREEGEIRLVTSAQDGVVALSVSDNGCGIPDEFLENRLFKPFSTTKSNGFGIGLYHSKCILEAHGGSLQVHSQVGNGSSFTVLFPVERGQ